MATFSCLFVFSIPKHLDNRPLIENLCISYGAFCNVEDQMPLPRIIIIIPCLLVAISLVLEMINLGLLCSVGNHTKPMLNFFLGKFIRKCSSSFIQSFSLLELTSIALTSALTIHCTWMTIVHIRISMEMSIVHLDWTFFAFTLGAILIPIDCVCSISRVVYWNFSISKKFMCLFQINNCQYEKSNHGQHTAHVYSCRHRSLNESDI